MINKFLFQIVDPFIREQIKRHHKFRRWLATIMGENVETFTDQDMQVILVNVYTISDKHCHPQSKNIQTSCTGDLGILYNIFYQISA